MPELNSEPIRAKGSDADLLLSGGVLQIRSGVLWGSVPDASEVIPVQRITSIQSKPASSVTRGNVRFNLNDGRTITIEFPRRRRHDFDRLVTAVVQAAAATPAPPGTQAQLDPHVSRGEQG